MGLLNSCCFETRHVTQGRYSRFLATKDQALAALPCYITRCALVCNSTICFKATITGVSIARSGTLPRNVSMSEDLWKNYYSHLYFTVVTFLTKIQNWCYITKKLVKTQLSKKLDGKNYYCPKNLDGKNHYHPSFWLHDQKLGWEKPLPSKFLITWPKNLDSSRISIPLFLLVRFWILARNGHCFYFFGYHFHKMYYVHNFNRS